MRHRALLSIAVLALVQVVLALGIWLAARPPAPVAAPRETTEAAADTARAQLAELYASIAFRSVITFDYAALSELVVRSASWPDVLFVSVEDANGKIVAHTDRTMVGQSADSLSSNEFKARYVGAYREVTAAMSPSRTSQATGAPAGLVRVGYSVGAAPVAPADARGGRERSSLGIILAAAGLSALPVGALIVWLCESSDRRRRTAREAKMNLAISELAVEAEEHRSVAAKHLVSLNEARAELAMRHVRVADAENEVVLLRAHVAEQDEAARRLHADVRTCATELDEARAALGDAVKTIAELEGRVQQRERRATAYMAHAVRSSMTNVLGFSKLLLRGTDGALNETQRDSVRNIQSAGDHLLGLVKDVADLTRLADGALELGREIVDIRHVLEAAVRATDGIGGNAAEVLIECPDPSPLARADRGRVAQIVNAILEHARRQGAVTVRARDTLDAVEVVVSAAAGAASPASLDEVFEPFPTAAGSAPTEDGGRRVRLALARQLVVAMGGSLSVDQDDTAVKFTMTLPVAVDALAFA